MLSYERSYGTGRFVCALIEIFGWLLVVVGGIVAIIGFGAGGVLGSGGFGSPSGAVISGFLSATPGLATVGIGLISIMLTQQTKATLDTAEMTRDLLAISRNSTHGPFGTASKSTGQASGVRQEPQLRRREPLAKGDIASDGQDEKNQKSPWK
ncbi:hypothetical protein JMM63_09275 [Rhodovulum sulfidophilum]|uniref:hypothetical protein n=1 Tax=Rhodovulum sulfidophilum TaxID=35806 RepID=UPI001921E3D0|nr:hypothetical protein [Rhodovulum sulfidophilum]MBL3595760.1 hypothetical protein [Rhodovulum sulfidophilum]